MYQILDNINVREYRKSIKNRQSRETGNIGYTNKQNTTLYANVFESK